MRTVLNARASIGYASRSRRGLHSVLDIETALATADTAAQLRDRIAAGEKISGPAARRTLTAAAQAPRFEGRIVPATFAKKAAAYLARDGMVLFDNPEAHLICVFKRDIALCEPGATAPNQHDCRRGYGNAARTDTHAHQLRNHADKITQLAAPAPTPIRDRLTAAAARHRADASAHESTATRLRRTVADQRTQIEDLRRQITHLTLASAVLTDRIESDRHHEVEPTNVVPLALQRTRPR